jgi:peptidoglycan/LPS O-acetylase OafA/YrhL
MSLTRFLRSFAPPRDGTRLLQLDLLRGIAIVLVLFTHASVQPDEAGSLQPLLAYLRYLGPSGVDLFFVLSGFLVGGLLMKEVEEHGRIDVRRFLIRRGFKIWPPYFAFLAFVGVWLAFVDGKSMMSVARRLGPNLLHLQNYFGSPRGHTWSLAVEEHFYLALPFLLVLLLRWQGEGPRALRMLPVITAGLCLLCALLRLQAYSTKPWYNPYGATHLRIDALFFGVALAYAHRFVPSFTARMTRNRGKLLLAAVALLAPQPALIRWDQSNLVAGTVGFTTTFLGYGCILLAVVHTPVRVGWAGRLLESLPARSLAILGYFSYPVYLWHIDVTRPVEYIFADGRLMGLGAEVRWAFASAIYILLALAAGMIFMAIVDRPSLALRDRLFPAHSGGAGHAAPIGVPAYSPISAGGRPVASASSDQ